MATLPKGKSLAAVAVLYFSLSLWFAITVFSTYASTYNTTKYIAEVLSVIDGHYPSSIHYCLTSCNVTMGGPHVLKIAVENPSVYPLVLLAREIRGNTTVAIVAYGSTTIEFNNTLVVTPYPTHPLAVARPRYIITDKSTSANVETLQILDANTAVAAPSLLAGLITSALASSHFAKKPLVKIYHELYTAPRRHLPFPSLLTAGPAIPIALALYQAIRPSLGVYLLVVGLKLGYPLLHALFKVYVFSKRLSLADKVGVLHTADLFLIFWIIHWAFDPLTNVVAVNWELVYILASIAYAASTFLLVVATFLLPAALLPFFRLRMLLLLVPFALNAEFAARRELCRWARSSLLRVTLVADGERHSGVVVACNDDAIVLGEEEEEHALPWGQVDSVVAVKEVAEIGREEAKALLARLRRELVRKVGLRAAKRGYIAVVKRAAPHDYIYVYVDGGGCRVAFDGRLPTVAKEAVGERRLHRRVLRQVHTHRRRASNAQRRRHVLQVQSTLRPSHRCPRPLQPHPHRRGVHVR